MTTIKELVEKFKALPNGETKEEGLALMQAQTKIHHAMAEVIESGTFEGVEDLKVKLENSEYGWILTGPKYKEAVNPFKVAEAMVAGAGKYWMESMEGEIEDKLDEGFEVAGARQDRVSEDNTWLVSLFLNIVFTVKNVNLVPTWEALGNEFPEFPQIESSSTEPKRESKGLSVGLESALDDLLMGK